MSVSSMATVLAFPRGRCAVVTALRGAVVAVLALGMAGCAGLPISGPTGSAIMKQGADQNNPQPFHIVEIDAATDLPAPNHAATLAPAPNRQPTDLIGSGDVLDIEIYEAGVALFAGSRSAGASAAAASSAGLTGGAQAEHLPATRVDDEGRIRVPFVGNLRAAGHTTGELATMIRTALRGMSQDPQVEVAFIEHISGSVIVGGEVGRPGRLVLNTNRETLSDSIALAGGYRGDAKDLVARVTRGGILFTNRLSDVMSGPDRDMQVSPGDRIELLRAPQTFSVMGAPGKVDLIPFASPSENLAEAVAAVGGANPYLGDAKAIFVFRFVPGDDGKAQPIVYHINMMKPGAYFLSQRFAMRDKDVVYVGNAASNQPSKLIQLVSQLFSPIVGVESGLVSAGVLK